MRARSGVPQRADCGRHQRIGPQWISDRDPGLGDVILVLWFLSPGGAGADNQGMDARRGSVEFAQADELEPPLLVAVPVSKETDHIDLYYQHRVDPRR